MSAHEARINDALKQLGEEFRLGMVQAEEYKSRRRLLLESWGERDATTSPGSLRAKASATATNRNPQQGPAAPQQSRSKVIAIVAAGVVALAAIGWFLVASQRPASGPAGAVPAQEPLNPQVAGILKAADDFLALNVWEAAAIDAFLGQWRSLSPADRAKANDQPSMRTLRSKLDQNLQAEAQLVAPDAPPEDRQRVTLLEDFARELAGEGT